MHYVTHVNFTNFTSLSRKRDLKVVSFHQKIVYVFLQSKCSNSVIIALPKNFVSYALSEFIRCSRILLLILVTIYRVSLNCTVRRMYIKSRRMIDSLRFFGSHMLI